MKKELIDKWNDYFYSIFDGNIDEFIDKDFGTLDIVKIRKELRLNNRQFPKQFLRKRYGRKASIMLDELTFNKEFYTRMPSEREL